MEATTTKESIRKKRRYLRGGLILCAIVSVALIGLTAARYVTSTHDNAPAVAAEFYFFSDKLTASGASQTVVWWNQDAPLEIKFQVKNAKDKLNVTEEPLAYTLIAQCDNTSIEIEYPVEEQTLIPEEGKPSQDILANDHLVRLTKSGDLPDKFTVLIKADAAAPYEAEIWAEYTVLAPTGIIQTAVTDAPGRLAAEWTVAVGTQFDTGAELPAVMSWPAGVSPDESDPIFRDAEWTAHGAKVILPTGGVHRILFYKDDPSADLSTSTDFRLILN